MEPVRIGKVKEVYDEGETLLFKFTDKISVFDKIIPSLIPGKGESLCRTSAFWFKYIKESAHVETDFIEMPAKNQMRVTKFFIPEGKGNPDEIEYLIPLEFITRYYVAGTLFDRLKSGKIKPEDIGLNSMPKYGDELDDPYFEVTTKFEKFDRPLTTGECIEIGGMTRMELINIRETLFKVDRRINKHVLKNGLIHVDGKKEIAFDAGRDPVLVDTFGTLDEDRFWEKKDYDNGVIKDLSKESIRQYYRSIGYHDKLYSAREKNLPEPDIPALPPELIKQTSELYMKMYERITGEKW